MKEQWWKNLIITNNESLKQTAQWFAIQNLKSIVSNLRIFNFDVPSFQGRQEKLHRSLFMYKHYEILANPQKGFNFLRYFIIPSAIINMCSSFVNLILLLCCCCIAVRLYLFYFFVKVKLRSHKKAFELEQFEWQGDLINWVPVRLLNPPHNCNHQKHVKQVST